jgi:hypothetical protein
VRTELRYPGLWRGCVGAWNPGLGPTGLTLRDWSGRGNHGTLTNGPTYQISSEKYSVDFDGVNDYVSISSGFTKLLSANNNHTISMWFAVDSFANLPMLFSDNSTATAANYFIELAATAIYWGTSSFRTYSGISLSTGQWYHICVVKTGSGDSGDLYLNGVLQSSFTGSIGNTLTASADLQFGIYANVFVPLNGRIDDVMIHHARLSGQQIRQLASRRGIAYELEPRRRASSAVQFNRRRRLLLGST